MPPPQAERPATSTLDVEAVQYLDALHAAALRLTRDAHAAQIRQDTFGVLRFGHRFEPGTNLRAGSSPSCTTRSEREAGGT
jgi:hypothetical protein